MLLKIQEPEQKIPPVALGIDLGTTHSLVAYQNDKTIKVIEGDEAGIVPSIVHYAQDQCFVGQSALQYLSSHPKDTIRSAKRLLGLSLEDLEQKHFAQELINQGQQVAYKTSTGIKTPIEVSAEILKHLYLQAKAHIEAPIEGAVITVPAYFDEAQRLATKHAAMMAQIPCLRLIHEPTAAAMAYGLEAKTSGRCLVFDLGGGTFDVTVLNIESGVFRVLATGGDSALGGDDIDHLLTEKITGLPIGEALWQAKKIKEQLSSQNEVELQVGSETIHFERSTFDDLIAPLTEKLLKIVAHVLDDAHLTPNDIDHIILVGGSTRIPYIQTQLEKVFKKPLLAELDPDKVVAMGAARHAASLIGHQQAERALLLDVTPLSLGIETMGGIVEKVILKNTPLPTVAKESFTTYENNQTGMTFHVVQGERELAQDNRSLAKFTLKGLPLLPKGHAKVEVTFTLNEEGLLQVTAQELSTQTKSHIEINPSYGLNDEAIAAMLKAGIEHAESDIQSKQLQTKRVEAKTLCQSIHQALEEQKAWHKEKEVVEALKHLENMIEQEDYEALSQAFEQLEEISDPFMRTRLDQTLKSIVHGKTLNQVSEVLCQK